MLKYLAVLLIFLNLTAVASCFGGGDEAEIRHVINSQADLINNRDAKGFLDTLASDSKERSDNDETFKQISSYDVKFKFEDIKVTSNKDGRAVARVVVTMHMTGQDARMTVDYTLVKESKGWKVLSSDAVSTEPLTPVSK
ncbi:MAG: hypothetical protein Q7O66_01575 [Dehalococcoidia bacterium]|nr:hypothetical protein [Dehalococcoidia bacterium]